MAISGVLGSVGRLQNAKDLGGEDRQVFHDRDFTEMTFYRYMNLLVF